MMRYDTLPKGYQLAAGRLVIDQLIGRGRSSAVYRAFDLATRSLVALKILDPFLAQDPVSLERFAREVQIIRQLHHPNIVRLYDFLREGEFHIICMEYIEGLDGGSYLDRFGRLSVAEFLRVAKAIAAAVGSCHRVQVLHRDLKPQNLLLTASKEVKLVDFGVSKVNTMSDLTKTGTVIGTPEYMAPEQFNSTTTDPRSDIYSLGAVFYQLLTERPPYVGASLANLLARQLSEDIEPIATFRDDVPPWVEAVIRKCLRTDRSARYQSCYELEKDLENGEKAIAQQELKRLPEPCLNCLEPQIVGLPFCHRCGTFKSQGYEPGTSSLVLYQCDEKDTMIEYLVRVFKLRDARAARQRLDQLPAVLLQGVSQATATAIANDLVHFPCEVVVAEKLPNKLRLPPEYLPYGLVAAIWPMFLFGNQLPLWVAVVLIAMSETMLITLYRRRVQPLLEVKTSSAKIRSKDDPVVLENSQELRRLRTPDLQALLGRIVANLLALRQAGEAASPGVDLEEVTSRVKQGLKAAQAIEGYALYLSSRSLNDLQQKLAAAALRLQHASTVEKMEPLVAAKARLQGEFKRFLEVQELHSRLFVALLNLHATLRRLLDGLVDRGGFPDLAAQLAGLATDLQLPEADLAALPG